MGYSQFEEVTPLNQAVLIVAATGLAAVPVVTSHTKQARIDALTAVNSDVIDHRVRVVLAPDAWSGGDLGAVLLPAGAGYTTGPPVDLLNALLPRTPYIGLAFQDVIDVAVQEVVTAAFVVTVFAQGGLF
jgi:hypothetical protein